MREQRGNDAAAPPRGSEHFERPAIVRSADQNAAQRRLQSCAGYRTR
jgi:hypothetical protein